MRSEIRVVPWGLTAAAVTRKIPVVAVAALALLTATPVDAQILTGRVLDGTSNEPLTDVAVTLLHPDGHELADPVPSDARGRFEIELPGPGSYYLRADLIGYTSIVDGIFHFESEEGRMDVAIYLRVEPVEIEGVDVRVEQSQARRHLRAAGFYERAAMGFGDFIPPEQIEQQIAGHVSDHLRRIPGVRTYSSLVLFRRQGPGTITVRYADGRSVDLNLCEPNVYVDGVMMAKATTFGDTIPETRLEMGLDAFMMPHDISAIEVYRTASSTPIQWSGLNGTCGAIVIWTKRGR